MNKRIALGVTFAAAAAGAALAGGVAYANDDADGADLRISYEQVQETDCPEKTGTAEADL
ncbi:hypothetical protein [Asanoa iriomotensis]|uniref:Uncharacterized protein n=1 Tax=Asanoa iriomotensis TaxID=234613 RepID=A0ABQ4C8F6_9ACTN|nr:hypothetical protein [Asanoa iriomotensis]GIF58615.1 hypothetical protein Air01nite_47100 [Asanoa iriomotensis]